MSSQPVYCVVTHRMSPEMHSSLREIAYRNRLSLNSLYNSVMRSLVDGELCVELGLGGKLITSVDGEGATC